MKSIGYKRKTSAVRFLLVMLLLLCVDPAFAQKMSISSFSMDEADQTANVMPTMRKDMNGDKCALIKITTTQKDFSFDVGFLSVDTVAWQNTEHPSEIWLYVPPGVMKISIQHPQFGKISDYDLGGRLKSGRTYIMELTSQEVNTLTVDYNNSQYLDVTVVPHEADFYINGMKQNLDGDGKASIPLSFGTYVYRAVANNYHPEESRVVINDSENKQKLYIRLKQDFGYISVASTGESKGGDLYIDNEKIGTLPITNHPVKSGTHQISILQKLYMPYSEKVTIADSAFVSVKPVLTPNYAEYNIVVEGDKDANIYDDGELLGTGSWKGKLESGDHLIEAKKDGHTTVSQKVTVVKDVARHISMNRPSPIYGRLEIRTTPTNASVFVDDKEVGKTSFVNNQILIGTHRVRIELKGHKTEEFDVLLKEGELERIEKQLTDYCDAVISSSPTADFYIDGKFMGRTPFHIEQVAGNYKIELSERHYTPYTKTLRLDGTTKNMVIKLHRNLARKNEFYLQVGLNPTGLTGFNAGMGMYINNVNAEVNFVGAFGSSDKIFWSDRSGESVPVAATYKPMGGNLKIGYGIRLNSRMRITPQVGLQYVTLGETIEHIYNSTNSNNWYSEVADKSSAISLLLGVRFNVAISPCIGLSVTPEYLTPASKTEGYKALSDVSTKIKNYSDGFNCNVSLNLFF